MRKIVKFMILLFLMISLSLVVVSCDRGYKIISDESEEVNKDIVLEVFSWQDEEENLNLLAEKFMETHPEIIIHTNFIPISEYEQQMLLLKNRDKQVDCIFNPSLPAALVLKNKNILKNLDSWGEIVDEEHYGKWYGEGEDICASYMLPYRMSRWAVFYNKTLFDKMGVAYPQDDWTWEEYADIAKRLSGEIDGEKIYGSMSFAPNNTWWRVPARTAGANDPMKKEDLNEFRKAAEWCYYLTYDLKAQMPYTEHSGVVSSDYNGMFLNGNIGMYYSGDWSLQFLNGRIKDESLDFDYDIAPMPHWEGKDSYVISDAAVISMAESTRYPEEAMDFMKFVVGAEGAKILAQNSMIPAWNSEEIIEIFRQTENMPEHVDNLFGKGKISSVPANILYHEALAIAKDEVRLYLIKEQSIDQTFQNINARIAVLKQE